jgi:hypothetical protein
MTHRMTARVVGALFILATVPFSLSVIVLAPILEASDFLTNVSQNEGRVGAGLLLELVNHIAVVGIAVVLYPVLRSFSERLALGYVAARSIEAALFAIATLHLLTLVFISQEFVATGGQPLAQFQLLGEALLAGHDWNNATLPFTAFSIGALTLNYTLLRSRLVPRWISVFGLLAAVSILTARIFLIVGVDLASSTVTAMDGPIFVQEMVFAVWLISKGFNPSALSDDSQGGAPGETRMTTKTAL